MVAKVEFEPVVVFVTLETYRTSEFPSGKFVFEWGEAVKVDGDGHVCG